MHKIELYYVKKEYRHLYDNKFINNKASLPFWKSIGVEEWHIDGSFKYVPEKRTNESVLIENFCDWYKENYGYEINKNNINIFLQENE